MVNARLDKPNKDGKTTPRSHMAGLAKRFRAQAQDNDDAKALARAEKLEAQLAGPECPPALRYLLDWLDEVYGRSGATMDGLAPLSWPCLESWSRLTRQRPRYHELKALLRLDTLRRDPPPEKPDDG